MLFVVYATDKTDILPRRAKFYRAPTVFISIKPAAMTSMW
jgi:hypothetical protein